MKLRQTLIRWLGGTPYPTDVVARINDAVEELNNVVIELRETLTYLERTQHDAR